MKWLMTRRYALVALPVAVELVTVLFGAGVAFAASLDDIAPTPSNSIGPNSHVFMIRKAAGMGVQPDVKLASYTTADPSGGTFALRPGTSSSAAFVCDRPTDRSGFPDGQYISVTVGDADNDPVQTAYISYDQACADNQARTNTWDVNANNVFYANYNIPNGNYQIDPETGKYKVLVSIAYHSGVPNGSTAPNLVQQRFRINMSMGGAKVGPHARGDRSFPIVGDWDVRDDGPKQIMVPFGLPCSTATARTNVKIGVYDADNGVFTSKVRFSVQRRDPATNSWVTVDIENGYGGTMEPGEVYRPNDRGVNNADYQYAEIQNVLPQTQYQMVVTGLMPRNTIDINVPGDTIFGAITCPGATPQGSTITIRPSVQQPAGIGIEPTETVRFNGSVFVTDFPVTKEWGYDEFARQNANNTGITATQQTYSTQQGAQDWGASGNVAFARECKDGVFRSSCANYRCQNGTAAASCGNYNWQCTWFSKSKYPGWSGSQPSCNIFGYYCKNSSGNWKTDPNYEYRDFGNREDPNGCNNRWNCPAPSGTPTAYGPDSSVAPCKIYRCLNGADPQNFYSPNGNGNGEADKWCHFRCNNGAGNHAALAQPGSDGKYGAGDLRCYEQPKFRMTCVWRNGMTMTADVDRNGEYCPSWKDETGQTIGNAVCAYLGVTQPSYPSAWISTASGVPLPGYGSTDGGATWKQVTTWSWNVEPEDYKCMRVVAKPTVKINGGDVAVGGRFENACSINPLPSSIVAWPHSPVYNASGTQFGAFASNEIFGFSSAMINSNPQTRPASGLAFANTAASGDRFGGGFGPMPCITDHAGAKPADMPIAGSLNNPTYDGSYQYMSNIINGNPVIQPGRQLVVYVDGDLRVESNITYNRSAPWPTPLDIPALKVVVTGNIYINRNVSVLDGVYVAQTNSAGGGGNIYTCSDGLASVTAQSMYADCQTKLTVNGAFIAQQVHFGRTSGTAIFGSTSEEINYLPEVWLAQWPRDNSGTQLKYDAMINLPPIL